MRWGKLVKRRIVPWSLLLLVCVTAGSGCTRRFFRQRADREVAEILAEKDRYEAWKIENAHVYADERARFADDTNPDRPPMPPDDPAARSLAPNPQKPPHHSGIQRIEGTGYLELLARWNVHNRQEVADREAEKNKDNPPPQPPEMPPPPAAETVPTSPTAVAEPKQPFLITLDQAVELGLINSREFQTRREFLYLSALPVTVERFAFSAQFFAIQEAIYEHTGSKRPEGKGDRWRLNGTAGFSKLFSTGALLLFAFANRTVIELGPQVPRTISTSTINLDIIQPLLQGGGKAVTLEPLTQAERNLVYDIRDYARFRKVFFQYITGGGTLSSTQFGSGGLGGGVAIANARLNSGNPASPRITPGSAGSISLTTVQTPVAEGYMPSLLKKATLRNAEANVVQLENAFRLFTAFEQGGDVSSLQVGQVRLQLLQGQTGVLSGGQDVNDSLEAFKQQLGMPVDVPLELDEQPIRPISDQLTRYELVMSQTDPILKRADRFNDPAEAQLLRGRLKELLVDTPLVRTTNRFRQSILPRLRSWEILTADGLKERLLQLRAERRAGLDRKADLEANNQPFPPAEQARLLEVENDALVGELELAVRVYETEPWRNLGTDKEKNIVHSSRFSDVRNIFVLVIGEALNERLTDLHELWPTLPGLEVCGVDLLKESVDVGYEVIARTALENRLDLMNARAQVVDAWRQVAVFANNLLGVFNVGYHMDIQTPPDQAQPLAFSGSRARHQLFLNAELPLVRLAERNSYRASLIAYQRARRNLMAIEDQIVAQVRAELRQLRFLASNYDIQKEAVELAYQQVDSALRTFLAPPAPGQGGGNTASNAAALTQQLLNAYARLPQVQNQIYSIWINYQIQRQQLYLDLELLSLDFRGVWIDEFSDRGAPSAGGSKTQDAGR